MKKIVLFLSAIVVLMSSCEPKNTLSITGTVAISGCEGQLIYLQALDSNFESSINIDSTHVKDGKFKFTRLAEDKPTIIAVLLYEPDEGMRYYYPIILEPGKVEIKIDEKNFPTIKGTPMNDKLSSLLSTMGQAEQPDKQTMYEEFVKGNIDNQVGVFFFTQVADILSVEQKRELLTAMAPEFKNNEQIKQIEMEVSLLEKKMTTMVGSIFTDLKAKTPEGNDIALSDYAGKGKYVLVDFWASWCPPCRKEMPKLVELYNKYKNKDFEIVGISLDSDNGAWKNGIKKLNITWPQISDLNEWDSGLAEAYGVDGIPRLILIDRDGKIIEDGLDADEVGIKLAELMK